MAPVVVVTGPPGAGKSTVSEILVHRYHPSALVAGDEFFAFLRSGYVDPWRPEAEAQNQTVVAAAAAATGRLAAGGVTVVYDGVIGPWFVDAFRAAAGVATLHYAVLVPPERLCLDRVAARTGHGFTDADATRHMYAQFVDPLPAPRHVVAVAATDTAADLADRIANAVAAGVLLV